MILNLHMSFNGCSLICIIVCCLSFDGCLMSVDLWMFGFWHLSWLWLGVIRWLSFYICLLIDVFDSCLWLAVFQCIIIFELLSFKYLSWLCWVFCDDCFLISVIAVFVWLSFNASRSLDSCLLIWLMLFETYLLLAVF